MSILNYWVPSIAACIHCVCIILTSSAISFIHPFIWDNHYNEHFRNAAVLQYNMRLLQSKWGNAVFSLFELISKFHTYDLAVLSGKITTKKNIEYGILCKMVLF